MKPEHADFDKTPPLFSLVNTFKASFTVYNGLSLSLKLMAVSFAPKLVPPTSSGQQQANVLLVCDRSFIRFLKKYAFVRFSVARIFTIFTL